MPLTLPGIMFLFCLSWPHRLCFLTVCCFSTGSDVWLLPPILTKGDEQRRVSAVFNLVRIHSFCLFVTLSAHSIQHALPAPIDDCVLTTFKCRGTAADTILIICLLLLLFWQWLAVLFCACLNYVAYSYAQCRYILDAYLPATTAYLPPDDIRRYSTCDDCSWCHYLYFCYLFIQHWPVPDVLPNARPTPVYAVSSCLRLLPSMTFSDLLRDDVVPGIFCHIHFFACLFFQWPFSILSAFIWVMFDEPVASDYIRVGLPCDADFDCYYTQLPTLLRV